MDITIAVKKLESLAQESRLKAFRILVKAGEEGLPAGKISEKLQIPNNTLSFHLSHLSNANLITSRKDGRLVIYSINLHEVEELIKFLFEKCFTDSQKRIRADGDFIQDMMNLIDGSARKES